MTTITTRDSIQPLSTVPAPTESSGARLGAGAGVAFVALNVATLFVAGTPPASDASATKVAHYLSGHAGAVQAQLLLSGLGIAALLWWSGTLWRMLSRAEGERPRLTAAAGMSLAVGLALALVSGSITASAAFRVDDVRTTHLLWNFSFVVLGASGFAIGTFLLATNAIVVRTKVASSWIAYLGWLAAIGFFAGTASTVTDASAATAICLVAFLVWCVWILAVSATMWRTADA
jgi:hypothetical protein